jgi:hypothetical protein
MVRHMRRPAGDLGLAHLQEYAIEFGIPLEDVLFTALNYHGVRMDVPYNRMRTAVRLNARDPLFAYSAGLGELDYYLALPVREDSPFAVSDGRLELSSRELGRAVGATEDYCDSHYPRRLGTVLNINPNTRTSCRGCEFCYTAYQVPLDRVRMSTVAEISAFFTGWMRAHDLEDLSHLIEVAVVTGCYHSEQHLVGFLLALREVTEPLGFAGKIFYLGSTLTSPAAIRRLGQAEAGAFSYCVSVESFERRHLLHRLKQALSVEAIKDIMAACLAAGIEVSYTYVLGLEPLSVFLPHMRDLMAYTDKFPIVNILQIHQQHAASLLDPSAGNLDFFFRARLAIEDLYLDTPLRPLAWENYRSPWYLRFGSEVLPGPRFPDPQTRSIMAGLP